MTKENCKEMVCALLESSELNTIIDQVITSQYVSNMLEDTALEKFIPRVVLSVAIKKEYERFRPVSETGISIEESIRKALSM
ncbi:MAG: hypothetical protein RR496_06750 [Lachnospiraceae bacterium]